MIANDTNDLNLSADQRRSLAEIVLERFGRKLSRRQFVDCLHLLCEDIAGFEASELRKDAVHRIWTFYRRVSG